MPAEWILEELMGINLQDERLNNRLLQVLSQLGAHPRQSIPAACGGYAEMAAAYRFFDNEKVRFDNVLAPHIEATRRRMAEQPLVILAQDTTDIDLTRPEQQVAGAGPMGEGSRRGVFLHLLAGFTPDGTPLGTAHATAWSRDDKVLPSRQDRKVQRAHTAIEQKESWRWVDALRQAREEARLSPQTRFLCVADSEADIYELFVEAESERPKVDWIVRASHNRALAKAQSGDNTNCDTEPSYIREQVFAQNVRFTQSIHVRARKAKIGCNTRGREQPRQSRTTEVEVRAARLTLRPPPRHDRKLPEITLNVVFVREIDPPADDTPVEWLLLTSLPIKSNEQVREVIQSYCVRWMIELFFRTLKSGCRIQERRFEHVERLLPCLAVYLIVSWRTLYVCRLGRESPDVSCEAIFEPAEWKSIYRLTHRETPPREPPNLREMIRMVAQLGGYVNRARSDEPGPQTVWLGLQRLHDIALCWKLFGPETRAETGFV